VLWNPCRRLGVAVGVLLLISILIPRGKLAAQDADIQLNVADGQLTVDDGTYLATIREVDVRGDGTLWRSTNPGYAAEGFGIFAGGDQVFVEFASPLWFWNGSRWGPAGPEEYLRVVHPVTDELVTLLGSSTLPQELFIEQTDAFGGLHTHITFELGAASGAAPRLGAYTMRQRLSSPQYASSDPFFVVFNNGLSNAEFRAAAAAVPEASSVALAVLAIATAIVLVSRSPRGSAPRSALRRRVSFLSRWLASHRSRSSLGGAGTLILGIGLVAVWGCNQPNRSASPKGGAVQDDSHNHDDLKGDHDDEEEPPSTFAEAVQQIASLRDQIKEAFAGDDLNEADHAVHEIGHVFKHVAPLASKEGLSDEQQKHVSDAVDQLFECFGAIDKKLHGREGKSYAEVEEQVDGAIAMLQSLVPDQEK
jgi:hypothetical protein